MSLSVHFVRREAMSSKCRLLKQATLFDCVTNALALSSSLFVFHSTMTCVLSQLPEPLMGYCRAAASEFYLCIVLCDNRHYDTPSDESLVGVHAALQNIGAKRVRAGGRSAKKRRMTPGKNKRSQESVTLGLWPLLHTGLSAISPL